MRKLFKECPFIGLAEGMGLRTAMDGPWFSFNLSIVMPCLKDVETVGTCVSKGLWFLEMENMSSEVIATDNGSTRGSKESATLVGGRVVRVLLKGYGSTLRSGIEAARGMFVIAGDSDDSYDLLQLRPFVD
jgi:hypothetical protein